MCRSVSTRYGRKRQRNDCAILGIADRALTTIEETGGDTSDQRRELAFVVAESCTDAWHTVHSTVYDIDQKKMYVVAQEGGEELEYSLT